MNSNAEPARKNTADPETGAEPGGPDTDRSKASEPVRSGRKIIVRSIAAILVVALGIGGYQFWKYSQTYEETDDAQINGPMNIVSTRIPGTVLKVYVVENQAVQAGQLLLELDPSDYQVALEHVQASLSEAQAQVRVQAPAVSITATTNETGIARGRANVASAEATLAVSRRDLEVQEAGVTQAEAQNARAIADLGRYEALVKKDQVSRLEYDEKVAAAKSAAAALESARAGVRAARQAIEQKEAMVAVARSELDQSVRTAPEQLTVQRATLEHQQASTAVVKSTLDEARLNLKYTKIFAPISGLIGKKNVEPGQRIQPGQQLLAIVPLDDIWVTANFKETQLKEMKAGQKVTIHVDAYNKDYEGYVDSLPPASAARFSILPPENASGNYVRVVQRLPIRLRFKPGQDPEQRLRPGMSVVPKVWIK